MTTRKPVRWYVESWAKHSTRWYAKRGPFKARVLAVASRARLRAEEPDNRHIITRSPKHVPDGTPSQAAEVRRLKRENTRLRKELADFRDFGLRCDTNPTYAGQDKVDGVSDHSWCHGPTWWQRYIDMADKGVRERARAALRGRRGR